LFRPVNAALAAPGRQLLQALPGETVSGGGVGRGGACPRPRRFAGACRRRAAKWNKSKPVASHLPPNAPIRPVRGFCRAGGGLTSSLDGVYHGPEPWQP